MNKNFAIFILSHGRANKVITYNTIKKCGYTGEIYIIIDNEDSSYAEYKAIFGDSVVVFDKKDAAKNCDIAHNDIDDRRGVIYARNSCHKIAKELNLKYFLVLDDDYSNFHYKFNKKLKFGYYKVNNLDKIISSCIDFMSSTPTKSIALSQAGDFIGGADNKTTAQKIILKRKCMNSFFFATDRPFKFYGKINEDTTMYVHRGSVGDIFFTTNAVSLTQKMTQANSGGLTELYLDSGTYVKSFYTVIFAPSCTKVKKMGSTHKRLHHSICWRTAVPKIINEKYRK